MKKILILNYEFPPLGGGASPVGYEIAKRYVQRGHEVDVVTMGYKGLPKEENIDGINVIRVPSLRSRKEICRIHEMLSFVISAIWFLNKRLKTVHYDINHTHFIIPTGIISLWAKRKFGLDYIVTSHGSDVPGYNDDRFTLSHRLTKPLLKLICLNAKKILPSSNFLKKIIIENIDTNLEEKIEVIPNGIDPNIITPKEKTKTIIATGRLLPRKGFQHLIKAVSDENIGYEVHIFGDGPMMPELRRMAGESKTKIILHGWVNNKSGEYREALGRAAIYCLPSSKENASVSLLEGMSAGCAVITTNVSGCPETVSEAGIVVGPENSEGIRSALIDLINNPEKIRDYQEKARQRVSKVFEWNNIINQYLSNLLPASHTDKEESLNKAPLIPVVILSMNKMEDILVCIESVKNLDYKNTKIVIIDNGSTDGTPDAIEKKYPDVFLIRNKANQGIIGGRNQGWQYVKQNFSSEYILFLDNDTILDPRYLTNLYNNIKGDNSTGLAIGKAYCKYPSKKIMSTGTSINFWMGTIKDRGEGEEDMGQYNKKEYIDAAPGFGNLISMRALDKSEGWSMSYNPYGWDDADLCLKMREHGYRILYIPEATIYHSGTRAGRSPIPEYERSKTKNYFRIINDHASLAQKVTVFTLIPFRWLIVMSKHILRGHFYVLKSHVAGVFYFLKNGKLRN